MTLVLETVVKATCVLASAWAVNAARRRASAASRHFVWTLAVAALLVLPVLSAALPRWDVEIPVSTARHEANHAGGEGDLVTGIASSETAPAIGETQTDVPVIAAWSWAAMAAGLYLAGLCVLVLRLGFERRSTARLATRAAEVNDPEWTQLLLDCATRTRRSTAGAAAAKPRPQYADGFRDAPAHYRDSFRVRDVVGGSTSRGPAS